MEEYAEELRTPPIALIALVGCQELHHTISTHLHSDQPPINTLAMPDFASISSLLPPKKDKNAADSANGSVPGIIKRDWLLKHRTRIPAVIAALFSYAQISGDPTQWLQVCTDLENLKFISRGRNIRLVLIIVQETPMDEINEERMTALRKRAEVESKHVIFVTPNTSEFTESLNRLAIVFAELANTYYRDEGRRIKTRIERKSYGSVEMNIRCCFKVAVYAEFRRDWAEALRLYEDAYHALREMVATSTRLPATQRLVEIKTIAELLYFKISTLLLHGGKVAEAVKWFRQHNTSYRRLIGSSEVAFLHWEWMSRQYLVFAELLETSSAINQGIPALLFGVADKLLTEWEFLPAYYYQLAASYLKEKRSCLELSLSMMETASELNSRDDSVIPSVYMGQFARLVEQDGGLATHLLTDEEYIRFTLAEGKRFQDSFEIIALNKKSFESYNNLKVQRMASYCGFQMALEYFSLGDLSNAKEIFEHVAAVYRQEGWIDLLWEALGYLRECSKKQLSVIGFVEYSLEMAAVPIFSDGDYQSFKRKECGPAGLANYSQRENIHREVFGLVKGENKIQSDGESNVLEVSRENPILLEIDIVSPLRIVLLASIAFHEQTVKPGMSTSMTLSLLSQLPLPVEIDQLEVQFNQADCNFTIINSEAHSLSENSSYQSSVRMEISSALVLTTNKWLRLTYDIKPEQSGKLECVSVVASLGPNFKICCRAESPASMNGLPLWKFENQVETFPTKDPALAFTGQKAIQVEESDPLVDLCLSASGPALVGERFTVPVKLVSKGHPIYSGELKINLVDVKGGGLFSPREMEVSSSMDSHHVELVGVTASGTEEETSSASDCIIKLQHSFGLLSVPTIKEGESWSCKLEIKWHRPKPIMLYVSLGYSPYSAEPAAQKVNVHKSLQIEGKIAVSISQRFMLPFRRDPLLLSAIKSNDSELAALPVNETNILIVSAKNCSEVPLQILSASIEPGDGKDNEGHSCTAQHGDIMPGEEFKRVFSVTPEPNTLMVSMGTLCLRWKRSSGHHQSADCGPANVEVLTKHKLPDVNVELPPLVVNLECPPYAILGSPFTYFVKIRNQTKLLQEIEFTSADSQSFVMSGSHNDTVMVLPKTEYILSYKLVPLSSGLHQLPRVTITSSRYSAGFQPSLAATAIFIYPSIPRFMVNDADHETPEAVVAG
uniref:Trafficking protein particle complex subunit 11 domain-containing protein n=1 Tax=Kalanchoe fedtschenkoi TaxID=63787 RepID=A0A7N0TQY9_KALFE